MARNFVNRLWQSFLQLNLYKKSTSDAQTAPKEYFATRLYICSLAVVILIIAITSALLLRTVNKTEFSPSHTRFSRLASKHPNTIYCPCSKIGIAYHSFVTADVIFHQVCSSPFIQQSWIDMVFVEQNNGSGSSNDYRTTLSFFWQVIAGLCNTSHRTWTGVLADFNASNSFNPVAITEETVRVQTQATLDNAIYLARITLSRNLLAVLRVMSGNQIVSALATNFYLRYSPGDPYSISSPRMSPRIYGNCSCLHSQGCPHPATFNDTHGDLITIPGMIADCLMMDGALASTLECYYSQSCLSLLHHSSLTAAIQPLSTTMNKHFTAGATVEILLNEIMIDEVTSHIRFDLFYSQCKPAYCSYSYTHRFDALFIVTTIIGVFGGLSLVLRLIAPLIMSIILRWRNRGRPNNNLPHIAIPKQSRLHIILNHLRSLSNYIRQTIIDLNLFESQRSRTPTNIFREQLLTQVFILLLTITSIAAGFYTFLVVQSQVITVAHPSATTYQQLYNDHSDTLQCPCSQLSVPYGSFLNVTFVLHQVCSSDLVSSVWLNYLESFDPIFLPLWAAKGALRDFRTAGGAYFQLLATFCSLAKNNIKDAERLFSNTRLVNDHVLASSLFTQQTHSSIASYIINTQNDFQQTLDWIIIAFTSSYFLTGTNTNSDITVYNNSTLVIGKLKYGVVTYLSHARIAIRGVCACPVEHSTCFATNALYTIGTIPLEYEQIFSALKIGCIPLIGFLQSTFTWWYKETYLENIQDTYIRVIDSRPSPQLKSLDPSVSTRYGNDTLNYLLRQIFIERSIDNESYFDLFYDQCAPISCSYTIVRRRDLIVVLLLLISICGGLNKILRIIVQAFGKVIFFVLDWWKNRDLQQPSLSIAAHLKHMFHLIYKSIVNINLYKTTSTEEMDLRQQIIQTRIYLVLFIGSLGVLLFYTAIIERSVTRIHPTPSIEDYEHLVDLYPDNINCPCTRISIPYNEFITELRVKTFHQMCSTNLIDSALYTGTEFTEGYAFDNSKDFRNFQAVFYTSLRQLCALAQQNVNTSIRTFRESTMFANQIMSRSRLTDEINATLDRFKKKTPIEFTRTLNLIRTTIQANALIAVFSTNWQLVIAEKGKGRNASFRSVPTTYVDRQRNTSCSCATSQACTTLAQFFNGSDTPYYIFPGLRLGCYSLETVLQSSLSCFYSMTCIYEFRQALPIPSQFLMLYRNSSGGMIELNSTLTRFSINDTIEALANEMFIESWSTNVSYDRFFNSCASAECSYKIYYRFDALELLSTFLSVYAGLSLVIHFMVPHIVKMIKKIRNRFRVVPVQ